MEAEPASKPAHLQHERLVHPVARHSLVCTPYQVCDSTVQAGQPRPAVRLLLLLIVPRCWMQQQLGLGQQPCLQEHVCQHMFQQQP